MKYIQCRWSGYCFRSSTKLNLAQSLHSLLMQIISVVLCLIALIYLLADGEDYKHALGFIVVLLVASIPIAIEIVRCPHPL